MFENRCYDKTTDNMDINNCNQPIYECPQERCINREINHCIEHIVPVNTRIINHHVYHHIYKPMYTCQEENVCSEVRDNNCCF